MKKIVDVNFIKGALITAEIDGYTVITDQPVENGGSDLACNPFQLFMASVATCAGYFALMNLTTKRLPTEGLNVRLECVMSETQAKRVDEFRIVVTPPEGLNEKQKTDLVNTVNKCIVKQHLQNPPEVTTVLD